MFPNPSVELKVTSHSARLQFGCQRRLVHVAQRHFSCAPQP